MKLPSPGRAWEDCLEAGVGMVDAVWMLELGVMLYSCLTLRTNCLLSLLQVWPWETRIQGAGKANPTHPALGSTLLEARVPSWTERHACPITKVRRFTVI